MICTAEGNSRPIAGFLPKTSISLREFLTASLFHLPLHTLYRTTRICEATLSRTEEECHPTVRGVRAGESVLGAEKTVALGTGLARERRLLITGEPPKQAEDRKKPNPSACTGLAEHLLPRRHGLIQSFLRSGARLIRVRSCPNNRLLREYAPELSADRLDICKQSIAREFEAGD